MRRNDSGRRVSESGLLAALDTHTVMRSSLQRAALGSARMLLTQDIDWFDMRESWDMTLRLADLVDSGVRQEAGLAQSFLGRAYGELGISPKDPAVMIEGSLRTGSTTPLSYRRVGNDIRRNLQDGAPTDVALDQAMTRFEEMLTDDLAMGMREQSRRYFMANGETTLGYRRVVRPELSTTGTCGLCMVASDMRYSRGDLMAIHTRCRCDTLPITRDFDPRDVNRVALDELYEAAGGTDAANLLSVKVKTEVHGELGPRLIPANQPGSATYKAHLQNRVPRGIAQDMEGLAAAERVVNDIEARMAAGVGTSYDRTRLAMEREQVKKFRESLRRKEETRQAQRALSDARRAA